MGGLPSWLLKQNPNIKMRTSDSSFLQYVGNWFDVLLPMIKPQLYENGGPIISVQIENEYGSYPACDFSYMTYLRDKFREQLGDTVVLFTTDEAHDSNLLCGKTQGLYATVDFQPWDDVVQAFQTQRLHEPQGPLVNSQYCPGWDDFWGYGHSNIDVNEIADTLDEMLAQNSSVNMYMFVGGTSFGFSNGALDNPFTSPITSYDFTAPISEAGDTTDKYFILRNVIAKYMPLPDDPVPANDTKEAYGEVTLNPEGSFFDLLPQIAPLPPVESQWPLSFEELGQAHGYVLYETVVTTQFMQPEYLNIPQIADRGYVFVDKVYTGILSRTDNITQLPIRIKLNQTLYILVENQGHIDYGSAKNDFKGIFGTQSVLIGNGYLTNWKMTGIPFDEAPTLQALQERTKSVAASDCSIIYPAVFSGTFEISTAADTFLDLSGWSKGIAFINGFNLGRYWPDVGPQATLYIPQFLLNSNPDVNHIVLFELESSPCKIGTDTCTLELIDYPILDAPTPYNATNFA
ncbi:hypothetical protein CHUAL_013281 [Chamberlinius hualienensis]